jgi:hypothetical protein
MTRTITARFAGTCSCAHQFAQGARVTYDPQARRVIACFDCKDLKAETMRRLHAALDPTIDATRSPL